MHEKILTILRYSLTIKKSYMSKHGNQITNIEWNKYRLPYIVVLIFKNIFLNGSMVYTYKNLNQRKTMLVSRRNLPETVPMPLLSQHRSACKKSIWSCFWKCRWSRSFSLYHHVQEFIRENTSVPLYQRETSISDFYFNEDLWIIVVLPSVVTSFYRFWSNSLEKVGID